MADVFKYNIADEGRLLPDADKPMARSVRMLYDAIGDGPDQFGEDAQALADKLLLRAPRRRGGNPDDDQDEARGPLVSIFDSDLDEEEIIARLKGAGPPLRGSGITPEDRKIYQERQRAFRGYAIVNLCDSEFLKRAKWGEFNGRVPNQDTVLGLATDFKTAGKRHWDFPLEAALDLDWIEPDSIVQEIGSLESIPILQLKPEKMGDHTITFFSGSHRKHACIAVWLAADKVIKDLDSQLAEAEETGKKISDKLMAALMELRSESLQERDNAGYWMVRISDISTYMPVCAGVCGAADVSRRCRANVGRARLQAV